MALYSELDERAAHLRAADETKTRFLSSVSHEFRTPVNSILALSKILLHRLDGELTPEQEKQVNYIRQAADQLSTLIDDLLDLRKVESGKIQLRVENFTVTDLFAALRGMFKPLATNDNVALMFDEPDELPELHTDQGKVSQILRNLVSNALKFTVHGSVRVTCRLADDGQLILFEVADTGIGIAPENHRRIFDEFSQVENPLQTHGERHRPRPAAVAAARGPARRQHRDPQRAGPGLDVHAGDPAARWTSSATPIALTSTDPRRRMALDRVLIIDDNEIERYALRQFLSTSRYEVDRGDRRLRRPAAGPPGASGRDLPRPDDAGRPRLRSA